MTDKKSIIIVDDMLYIRVRIKNLLNKEGLTVYEAANTVEFFNVMSKIDYDTDLILIDVDPEYENGFDIIKKLHEKNIKIPFICMTKNSRRDTFNQAVKLGAYDYLLKPFEDDILYKKIMGLLNNNPEQKRNNILSFDIKSYLISECRKAIKGKFNISVLLIDLSADNINKIDKDFYSLYDSVYEGIKELFWETDVFIKYEYTSFIGVFPFCDDKNTEVIKNKVQEKYDVLKEKIKGLNEYNIKIDFITYPSEVDEQSEIIDKLKLKANKCRNDDLKN